MDNMILVNLKVYWPVLLTHLAILTSLSATTNVVPMVDAVYLSFNGTALPNNTYIAVDMMGRMDNNSLICHTNNKNCCHISQTIEDYPLGEWRYPNGSIVHFINFRYIDDYSTFGRNRNWSIVRLWRVLEPEERGQFCCRIPDVDYVNHTLCSHVVDIIPFTIIVQPSSQYVGRGENATFSVAVKSTANLSYQWLKDGKVIVDRPLKYKGVTKSILAVQNVSLQDEGVYRCAITDHTGVALSDPASLRLMSLNESTTNCLCFTGISKDLCEAQKVVNSALSAADNLEKLSQLMTNILTSGKLQASDITFATALLERFEVASFQNEEISENFLIIVDNLMLSDGKELIKSQLTSNTSLRMLACLNGFMDHVHITNHSDASALTVFTRETFVLLIRNNITENFTFNMEHSDKEITLTTGLHSLTASVTVVVGDSVFENLHCRSYGQRISYSIFLKKDLFRPLDSGQDLTLQSTVFGIRINDAQIVNLSSPIEVYFRPDETMSGDGELLCGRWSTSHYGVWNTTACEVTALSINESPLYRTRFNQFGHFGLLLDLTHESNPLRESYSLALTVISYVLLTLSTLCLIAFIITYLTAKQLHSSQHCQILINLSLSLLFLYFGFLMAANSAPVPVLCGISATLLQFFILVYFGWTSVEAFFLYRNLVKVLLRNTPKFVLKAAIVVYSSSLLITVLSAGPGYKSYPYHTQKYSLFLCRANHFPFWFGQILPFVATNIFNWSLFTIIIISVCKHRTNTLDKQGNKAKELTKSNIAMTIGLANLCGLGWIFGLAASSLPVEELTFTFQLLFNIFVGSQGMLLFFFHCVRNPQVQKQWKVWFTYSSSVCLAVIPLASTLIQKSNLSKSDSIKVSVQVSSLPHTAASVGNAEENPRLKSCKDDQSISCASP